MALAEFMQLVSWRLGMSLGDTPEVESYVDPETALSAPELEPDSMLIPSWYLKQTDPDKVLETTPIRESDSWPGSHEGTEVTKDTSTLPKPPEHSGLAAGQKAETAGQWELSMYYVLGTAAASLLLLLGFLCGFIIMYQHLKRTTRTQGEPGQISIYSSWESYGQPRGKGEAESEGPGKGERVQANMSGDSCRLLPEVFAAELAQLYKNMGTDRSPLPTCPFCALADGASSRDHWISLDSPQPTPSWCPCYQYQQKYFMLEDDDYFSDSI